MPVTRSQTLQNTTCSVPTAVRGASPAYRIRSAQPSDLDAIHALELQTFSEDTANAPYSRQRLQRYIRASTARFLVLESEEEETAPVEGSDESPTTEGGSHPTTTTTSRSRSRSEPTIIGDAIVTFSRRFPRVATLCTLAVSTRFRGRGHAQQLVAACEAAARERGAEVLRLEVRADNEGAIGLYERCGYRRFGEWKERWDDGESSLRFEKALSSGE
jgi:ribosomal protein S18 acetylase RimI-like enzyme